MRIGLILNERKEASSLIIKRCDSKKVFAGLAREGRMQTKDYRPTGQGGLRKKRKK